MIRHALAVNGKHNLQNQKRDAESHKGLIAYAIRSQPMSLFMILKASREAIWLPYFPFQERVNLWANLLLLYEPEGSIGSEDWSSL